MDSPSGRRMNAYLCASIVLIAASLFGFLYVTFSILSYTVQVFKTTLIMLLPETAASLFCGILGGYLLGISGRTTRCNMPIAARIPSQIRHVIIFSEYPDLAGRCYIECSEKVSFIDNWDNVLKTLEELHPGKARVAVLPNVEIQYCV